MSKTINLEDSEAALELMQFAYFKKVIATPQPEAYSVLKCIHVHAYFIGESSFKLNVGY